MRYPSLCERPKWLGPPPSNTHVKSLKPMEVTLFGKRIFADVVKASEMRYPRLSEWVVDTITRIPVQERQKLRMGTEEVM